MRMARPGRRWRSLWSPRTVRNEHLGKVLASYVYESVGQPRQCVATTLVVGALAGPYRAVARPLGPTEALATP